MEWNYRNGGLCTSSPHWLFKMLGGGIEQSSNRFFFIAGSEDMEFPKLTAIALLVRSISLGASLLCKSLAFLPSALHRSSSWALKFQLSHILFFIVYPGYSVDNASRCY